MTDHFSRCFDIHSFEMLNHLDYHILRPALNFYLNRNPASRHSGVFFDAGTNAGSFVKVLKDEGITQNIHCFEPHPFLAQKVRSVYPHVRMNPICLNSKNEKVIINIPEHSVGISSMINRPVFDNLLKGGQKVVKYEVDSLTLDTYCLANGIDRIDFIKIDVEGAEKLIFDGATKMLSEHRIKAGIFEAGQTSIDAGTSTEELISLITKYGYKINTSYSKSDFVFYIE
jgi:FkbM family methyltransferase